jgi:hypothetical protein
METAEKLFLLQMMLLKTHLKEKKDKIKLSISMLIKNFLSDKLLFQAMDKKLKIEQFLCFLNQLKKVGV